MRVVLVGGAGFIGTNLALKLKQNNYKVVVFDRPDTELQQRADEFAIEYVVGNYITGEGLDECISEGDIVVHLVSTSVPNSSNQDISKDAIDNIIPSIRLFELCVKNKVERIIYSSSGGTVYGVPEYTPIDERHKTDPTSAYGVHKVAVEKYLALMNELHGIKVNIMRISNPYGPAQKPFRGQGVISTFLASAFMDKTVEIWGDGESIRDYIYIEDLSEAFLKVMEYNGEEKVFNIGSGQGLSVNDILASIQELTNKEMNIDYIPGKVTDVKTNILECKKANDILGWHIDTPFKEGLIKMIDCWDEETKQFII